MFCFYVIYLYSKTHFWYPFFKQSQVTTNHLFTYLTVVKLRSIGWLVPQNYNRAQNLEIQGTEDFFFCLSFFTTIHESQDCRGMGRVFLPLHTITSTRFTGTQTLAGQLLQRAHLCKWEAAGLEQGTFGFREQFGNH